LYRARAIAHATAQEIEPAFAEIEASWHLMPPATCDQAADLAWLYLFSGDLPSSLETLKPVTDDEKRMTPRIRELLATCVALDPALWKTALGTATARGTVVQRVRAGLAVLATRARTRDPRRAAQVLEDPGP
jgi:hypothetical protein